MSFTNFQILTIFTSFFLAFWIGLFWQGRDRSVDQDDNREDFNVLMSVFFWSWILAFCLKLITDLFLNFNFWFVDSQWYFYLSLFFEELVKAIALIIWLELAKKQFNEVSDWVIYWVFAALGFIFFENILYVLTVTDTAWADFISLFVQRNVFSFSAHLVIIIFSTFYAISYLKSPKMKGKHRPKPWHLLEHIGLMWDWNMFIWLLYLLLSPVILLINLVRKTKAEFSIVLYWSFWVSVLVHILYDHLLELSWIYWFIALAWAGWAAFVLYRRFDRLDL